ncbi:MAG TPA: SirA family protein [Synergistaceae bacterium]|nr:SirA family protein [Synergistaceae bacterium]
METIKVDARGLSCPQPIVETKKVIDKLSGGRVEILVDTVTSRENVLRFGRNAGWKGSFEESEDSFKVILEK